MSAVPAGAAIDQAAKGWLVEDIVTSFDAKLQPLFMLATLTMEASGRVPPGALPMQIDLAHVIAAIESEWEAFMHALPEAVDRDFEGARGTR